MANKYVDVSATFNGDGTLSTPAASDGAAGAWNDFANAFKGTPVYGSVVAGDNIYVRTNDGINDLSYTISAVTLTSSTIGKVDAPINYIFDDGTVWIGDNGIFTIFLSNSLSSKIILNDYTQFNDNFHINHLYAGSSGSTSGLIVFKKGITRGGMLTQGVQTTTVRGVPISSEALNGTAILNGTYIYCGNAYSSTSYQPFLITASCGFLLVGCTLDVSLGKTDHSLFGIQRYGSTFSMIGGQFIGLTPNHKLYHASHTDTSTFYKVYLDGVDLGAVSPDTFIQNANPYSIVSVTGGPIGSQEVICNNVNGGFNYRSFNGQVYESWDSDGNFPTLNATLPDGTPWSIKVSPAIVHKTMPAKISGVSKLYVESPAIKTFTFELALHENYTTPDKSEFYVEVSYFDATTGASKFISTELDSGTLLTSTAVWTPNPPVYGADTFVPYKIQVTTPTEIKQNSLITAWLCSKRIPTFSTDYYFIDPEFSVA